MKSFSKAGSNERILIENERILIENERILIENERVLIENERIVIENERILDFLLSVGSPPEKKIPGDPQNLKKLKN